MRDQCYSQASSVRRNEQIIASDHGPRLFQVGANLRIMRGRFVGKLENFDVTQKGVQRRFILALLGRNFDTLEKFGLRNHSDAHIADRDFL